MERHQLYCTVPEENQRCREEDKKWINKWLGYKNVQPLRKFNSDIKVSNLQEFFQGLLEGFNHLEQLLENLSSKHQNMIASEWDDHWKELKDKQKDLEQLLFVVDDKDQLKPLLESVERVKRKRARKRKQVSKLRERRKQQTSKLHNKIDSWRAGIVQQEEKKKRDKEFQADADNVMSEVTMKKTEVQRLQKLVAALSKLHKLRRDSAMHHTAQHGDEQFNKIIDSLQDTLNDRLKVYVEEERALQVILEGQEEERKEKGRVDEEAHFVQLLFGDSHISAADPVYPYFSLFTGASHDLETFVQCRRNWDQYIGREGSTIPVGWVLPSVPSSSSWAAAIQN